MKKPAKSKSKVTKSVIKKSAPKRKVVVKKAIVAKKKPVIAKKVASKKKLVKAKKQGVLALISGALVVLSFVLVAASSTISSSQTASTGDTSVLGWFSNFTSNKFSAPAGLTAVTIDSSVTLTWKAVTKATSYNIYRSTSWFGGMKKIASGKLSDLTYTDNSTTASKNYRYTVSAFDGFKESGKSAAKSIKSSSRVMPVKPTIVGYDGGGDMLFAGLVWNYQPFVTGYYIYCDKCADTKITVQADDSYTDAEFGELMHEELNVVSGTNYTIQISAYRTINGKTTESAKSTVVAFTGGSSESVWPPAKPTGLKYDGTASNNITSVLWNIQSDAEGYYVYCNNCAENAKKIKVSTDSTVGSTYGPQMTKEFDVLAGRNYMIQVTAYKTIGSVVYESAKSAALTFNSTTTKVTGPPVPPLNFEVTRLTSTMIVFQFKSRHNVGGGDYLHCEQCAVQKMEVNSTNLGSAGATDDGDEVWALTGLTPGMPYHIALSSYNVYNGVRMESLLTEYKQMGTLPY